MDEVQVERRLAAILVADIAGYSRLMAEDEAATVTSLKGHQAVVLPLVEAHGGRIQAPPGTGAHLWAERFDRGAEDLLPSRQR